MKITNLFREFFNSEKSGGFLLIFCSIFSLVLTNIGLFDYYSVWQVKIYGMSLEHIINDGLMTVFFLLIGLELERELYRGELSDPKNASLSISAAVGGMLFPALIYFLFNYGNETQSGIGIPMATDIAFAIGILSLLGNKVPVSLKVFLTALAIVDDLGAIIIIALFYTTQLHIVYLLLSIAVFVLLIVLNRIKVNNIYVYLISGVLMWYFMLNSGIHATISGVLLAFVIPFRDGKNNSPSYKVQHFLHKPVAFIILPLFALANTSIFLKADILNQFNESYSLGIIFGLFLGKPLGITLFSFIMVKSGLSRLSEGMEWKHIIGIGLLAGIGFTMSIFISLLAFENKTLINDSKIMILSASVISGISGFFYLKYVLRKSKSLI